MFPCKYMYECMSFHNEFTVEVYESCIADFIPHCHVCSLNMVEKLHKTTENVCASSRVMHFSTNDSLLCWYMIHLL